MKFGVLHRGDDVKSLCSLFHNSVNITSIFMIVTYLEREEISLSIEVLLATQREIFIKLKANVVVLVNVL